MHRFFAITLEHNYFVLTADDVKQIKQVLRLKDNEQIICIYNAEHYLTTIEVVPAQNYLFKLTKKLKQNHESSIKIRLIAGLIRNTKWDYLLQKATELGVNEIIPFQFKRCVIQLKGENNIKKIERWTKICKEASEQSYRNKIPLISNVESDLKVLQKYQSDVNLVCYEKVGQNSQLKDFLHQDFTTVTIVIGPEGGFTAEEITVLTANGYNLVSLGQRILRAETAPLAILAMIMYEKEL
ncbi:16S rRNA (uracil(1498)-N(3))-methyltransferase [Spiroplasma poulsonii]|uniref:Ribosomal RNA small subunit methyltransferase E n=1 Tax=Spiroplasma poulsonii TaxID=2138 RepID=A0A3S0SK56_9MOLU|nr:16S rRNA (uracil(1498)-N(3))-methyltransferase [Spiroplasma poulsonii]MBW3057743.1 16S rRNA methyltransferase [Spiroplasma poulsonii]RUP75289.1 16S rRNA (uracil(1498)-N(3))-methyltransferase [Spiroplasma poulsonii]